MQKGTFRLPTVGSLVQYRARHKKGVGIVVYFEPNTTKNFIKGATRVLWLDQGVCEWRRWSSTLEIIA